MAVIICYLLGIVCGVAIMKLIGIVRERRAHEKHMRMLDSLNATITRAQKTLEDAINQVDHERRLPPVYLPPLPTKNEFKN